MGLLQQCSTGSHFLQPCSPGSHFLQPCPARWVACVLVISSGPCGAASAEASVVGARITVRSASPTGTTLTIPFSVTYYYGAQTGTGCTAPENWCDTVTPLQGTLSQSISLVVGTGSGSWAAGPTWSQDSRKFRSYWAGANLLPGTISAEPAPPVISGNPPLLEWTPEWCVNLDSFGGAGGFVHSCSSGLFPIWWEDPSLMSMVASDLNGDPLLTCIVRNGGLNYDPTPGSNMYQQTIFECQSVYKVSDPPLVIQPSGSNSLNAGTSAFGGTIKASYNRAAYTMPAGPKTTDDTFDLTVTFYNPYTANAVDGTHGDCDAQWEVDTEPGIDLVGGDPTSCGEAIQYSSITRTSYGVYVIHGVQFFCQAGSRQLEVWPDHEHTSFARVTSVKVPSGAITITAGLPYTCDMPQGYPTNQTDHAYYYRCNQPIQILGADVYARLLDQVGFQCLFNVCVSRTDNQTIGSFQNSGNAFSTSTLHGTLTQPSVSGVATFPGIYLTGLGGKGQDATWSHGYGLFVHPPTSYTRNPNGDNVNIGLTCGLAFEDAPSLTIAHGTTYAIKVDLVDYNGALINPNLVQDALTLTDGGSGFTGAGTATPSGGVASFTGSFPTAGNYTLSVSTSGVTYYGPGSPAPGYTDNAVTLPVTVT